MNSKHFLTFILGILILTTANIHTGLALPFYIHIFMGYLYVAYFFFISIKRGYKKVYIIILLITTLLVSIYNFYPMNNSNSIQPLNKDYPKHNIKSNKNELDGYIRYNSRKILVAISNCNLSNVDSIYMLKNGLPLEENVLLYNFYTPNEEYVLGTSNKHYLKRFKTLDKQFSNLVIGYTYNSKHKALSFNKKDTLRIYIKFNSNELKTGFVSF